MPEGLGHQFDLRLKAAAVRLSTVTEERAAESCHASGWLRKEELGHLLDSAANNLQRFVRAALDGHYEGPGYQQEAWVKLNGYATVPWAELLTDWRGRNAALSRVVHRIDDAALPVQCKVGDNEPVTLQFLIEDYLRHLEQHVAQIMG
ncbi:MAG: DinB family protein [Bryobacteraceae bacterium]